MNNFIITSTTSSKTLLTNILKKTNLNFLNLEVNYFADKEIKVEIKKNIINKDIIIIASICPPSVNDNFMELLLIIDALKRSKVKNISIIFSYLGYSRQERKDKYGQPISFKVISKILSNMKVNNIYILDNHFNAWEGFFDNVNTFNISTKNLFLEYIKKNISLKNLSILAPDAGSYKKSFWYSKNLDIELILSHKIRNKSNECIVSQFSKEIKNKDILIIDDMIDTAGTIVNTIKLLKEKGAKKIYIFSTHGLFSDPAKNRILECFEKNFIEKLTVTNSIKQKKIKNKKLEILELSSFFADIIKKIINNQL